MAYFHWVGREALIASARYTVLAQAISPNDDGALLWDVFMPRKPVPSVKVSTLTQLTPRRFVGDRREWNARGRYIPQEFPGTAELEMIPIETFFKLGEREIQDIEERLGGRADGLGVQEFLREVGIDFDTRVEGLAAADYRRVEMDVMRSWATGSVTAMNPTTGATYSMSYGMSGSRYQTASPAWTGGSGGTAYQKFIDWLLAGYDMGIQIAGAMMRTSTREAIRASAPNLAFPLATNITPTLADVERRISDELGTDFRFYTNERTLDLFDDGGIATTQTKVWPAQTVAVVPAGEAVGYSAFAPVARAGEMSRAVPEARIDRNACAVFLESANGGRDLTVEAQINMMPIPDENRVWVINAGI
jgi:hypothetical protein